MIIIRKSIFVEIGGHKKLSWCAMPNEFYISIIDDPKNEESVCLGREEAIVLIEELTNFVNNKEK